MVLKMKLLFEGWRAWIGLDKEAEPEEAPEPEEEESQEAKLAMLSLHEDEANREQALMMFEMLADGLDLDLLATELDKKLHATYDEYQRELAGSRPGPDWMGEDPWGVLLGWYGYLKFGEEFISGDGLNREVRLSGDIYKLGSAQGMIARALKQTARLWREQ